MPRTATPTEPVEKLLEWGCARNVPVELQYETSDGVVVTGRARLVDVTERRVMTDRPLYMNDAAPAPVGARITVHMSLRGARLQFESVIEETGCLVRFDRNRRIAGIALRKPSLLEPSQRRMNLRISVLGYDPVNVNLVRPHRDHPYACATDAPVLAAWLLDLSVGGVSALLDRSILASVTPGERFFLSFCLPTVEDPFFFLSAVCHKRLIDASDSLRLGLRFLPWPGISNASEKRRISRFINAHERRMLRRRR